MHWLQHVSSILPDSPTFVPLFTPLMLAVVVLCLPQEIKQPSGGVCRTEQAAFDKAKQLGYPVMVRTCLLPALCAP